MKRNMFPIMESRAGAIPWMKKAKLDGNGSRSHNTHLPCDLGKRTCDRILIRIAGARKCE